jgi:hypothetical protein
MYYILGTQEKGLGPQNHTSFLGSVHPAAISGWNLVPVALQATVHIGSSLQGLRSGPAPMALLSIALMEAVVALIGHFCSALL